MKTTNVILRTVRDQITLYDKPAQVQLQFRNEDGKIETHVYVTSCDTTFVMSLLDWYKIEEAVNTMRMELFK